MKNKKIIWTALPFLAGAILEFPSWDCSPLPVNPNHRVPKPLLPESLLLMPIPIFKTTSRNAIPYTSKMKGFTIDKAELNAMNIILGADPSAAGFRFYFGTDASGTGVAIICGTDAKGSDITGSIYSAVSNNIGPCPTVCDAGSPIAN